MKRILFQLQLSSYDANGTFIMTADSNWQVFITKAINMIRISPTLQFDVLVPYKQCCRENLQEILNSHNLQNNVRLLEVPIVPNALQTRYDFPFNDYKRALDLQNNHYTHVYLNDPMLVRHFRALFFLAKQNPLFISQCHFLDTPQIPLVPSEVSYWEGTVEGSLRADLCMWHSNAQETDFFATLEVDYQKHIVDKLRGKSIVWKSGYSIEEIRKPVNESKIRFDRNFLEGKTVIWCPNRVGGLGKSFDYTNLGKFLFDIVPQLWKTRQDFVVLAGNPNQKISNAEIAQHCPAYMHFDFGALNRDEYRWISQRADIVVGLYGKADANGGLASLESLEFNAVPLFTDVNEYKHYMDKVSWPQDLRVNLTFDNAVSALSKLLDCRLDDNLQQKRIQMQEYIRSYATYEHITENMMRKLNLL